MKKTKVKVKRKYNTRPKKEESFFYPDNAPKLSAEQNKDANRSLVGAIFSQAFDDFLHLHKHEIKPPKKTVVKRKKFIKNIDKQDRLETSIDFLHKDNPLFIYYCELLDFEPDWVAKKMYCRIKDYYLNKADIYLKKKGLKKKKRIPLPVENVDSTNLYCASREWKNVNNKCIHGKEFYCKECLHDIPGVPPTRAKGSIACQA